MDYKNVSKMFILSLQSKGSQSSPYERIEA